MFNEPVSKVMIIFCYLQPKLLKYQHKGKHSYCKKDKLKHV